MDFFSKFGYQGIFIFNLVKQMGLWNVEGLSYACISFQHFKVGVSECGGAFHLENDLE